MASTRLQQLSPILGCPVCRAPLAELSRNEVSCGDCGNAFEVAGGVPILLDPEERAILEADYGSASQMRGEYRASMLGRVRKLVKRLVGSSCRMKRQPIVDEVDRELESEWILEIGSGTKSTDPSSRRVHLDIGNFVGVDVVGSGLRLPFRDNAFSMVRSLAVLEHVRQPQLMLAEIERVLKPGGYVYTEIPFLQHYHAYPNDFQRLTKHGLRQAFATHEVVAEGVVSGPSSAITALIGDYCELWTFSERRWLNDLVRTIPLVLLWPLKFLDYFLVKNPRAHEIASGLYLLSRKPLEAPTKRTAAGIEIDSVDSLVEQPTLAAPRRS